MSLTYAEKLKDPRWVIRARAILERDGYRCRNCGAEQDSESDHVVLNVHHKVYYAGHAPWEYGNEVLITYCRECHQDAHELFNELILNIYDAADGSLRFIKRDILPMSTTIRSTGTDVYRIASHVAEHVHPSRAQYFCECVMEEVLRRQKEGSMSDLGQIVAGLVRDIRMRAGQWNEDWRKSLEESK